jgi:hypothetical protein
MRNTVLMGDASKYYARGWYVFKGLSLVDFSTFFTNTKTTRLIYIDVYSDKYGKLSRKLSNTKPSTMYKATERKNERKKSGTDILIFVDDENLRVLNLSPDTIFELVKTDNDLMNGVDLFCSFHDIDWNAVCYFRDQTLFDIFVEYLKKKTNFIITNDWNDFS